MDDILRDDQVLYKELGDDNSEGSSFNASIPKKQWEKAAAGITEKPLNQLVSQTVGEITQHGFQIDVNTAPYKQYDAEKGERFLIQKCKDISGRDVVVKVSSADDESKKSIHHEAAKYKFLATSIQATPDTLSVHFPAMTDAFRISSGQEALAVTYEKDDPAYKQTLTPEQQTDIIIRTIKDLHKLTIPSGVAEQEAAKPWDQRDIDISTGDQVRASLQRHVDSLVSQGLLPEETAQKVLSLAESDQDLLSKLPLKVAHGDLHMGNLAISQNPQTGESDVTLMDIEALRVSNEFYDVAHIANKIEVYRHVLETYDLPPAQKQIVADILGHMRDPQLIPKLEGAFIEDKDDEKGYVLMRLADSIGELDHNSQSADGRAKIIRDVYPRMITNLLARSQVA